MPRNPFAPPLSPAADSFTADPGDGELDAERLRRIADARKGVESALWLSLCAQAIGSAAHGAWLLVLLCAVLTIRAVLALHAALDDGLARRAATVLAMFIPLVNLAVMAALCARGTRRIRANAARLPPFDPLRR